jgi:hypothetical protein
MCSVARAKSRSPPPTTHLNKYHPRTDLTNSLSYRCLLPQLSSITSLQPHRTRPPPLPLSLGSSSLSQTAPSLASASISFTPPPLRRFLVVASSRLILSSIICSVLGSLVGLVTCSPVLPLSDVAVLPSVLPCNSFNPAISFKQELCQRLIWDEN